MDSNEPKKTDEQQADNLELPEIEKFLERRDATPQEPTEFEQWKAKRDALPERPVTDASLWAEGKSTARPTPPLPPMPKLDPQDQRDQEAQVYAARPIMDKLPDLNPAEIDQPLAKATRQAFDNFEKPPLPEPSMGGSSDIPTQLEKVMELLKEIKEDLNTLKEKNFGFR